ncbi:non-ribosomal peptide synthetase [Streptomyces sp. ADMS]|uniref:non-ribosomal peptide synthetase n=1 Tax=Streptomyces sp. ADMS TaxID=3071415 RepID=UPI00296EF82A|nr:non-ribosomal peptide synthetase [Streptomyces sp. ADMS]MDW4909136.1 non-ribosomal peptide synthetase [Streptomyces sp. ADMS]
MQDTLNEQAVVRLLQGIVDSHPDTTAVECGVERLTYRQLWDAAEVVADQLRGIEGFQSACLVGLRFDRGIAGIAAQLGCWLAGAAYLPLDPALPEGRIASILRDAQPFAVLERASRQGSAKVRCYARSSPRLSTVRPAAYVIYTSGSTGAPKGVEVGHASLANLVEWHGAAYGIRPAVRVGALAGLGFDATVWETWAALAGGATLVLPTERVLVDSAAIAEFIEGSAITHCFLSTPLAEQLFTYPSPPASLAVLLTGGDRLRVYPPEAFPAAVFNHYGPTEATVVTTASGDLRIHRAEAAPVIGRPITGGQARLVDVDGAVVTEPGVPGELLIGGSILALGYRNDPELTARRFLPGDGDGRWYASGDICRWTPAGELEFVERRDAQVSIRGHRVELAEVEQEILAVPGVDLTAVVHVPDPDGGSLRAFYCGTAEARTIRSALTERLPTYMLPAALHRLDAMPLTPNGKIDRTSLLASRVESTLAAESAEPRTTEERIAEIWSELTGNLPGPRDSFFETGGHSLIAARAVSRTREQFGIKIGLQTIFSHPVLADFSAKVDEAVRRAH